MGAPCGVSRPRAGPTAARESARVAIVKGRQPKLPFGARATAKEGGKQSHC